MLPQEFNTSVMKYYYFQEKADIWIIKYFFENIFQRVYIRKEQIFVLKRMKHDIREVSLDPLSIPF